MKLMTYLHIARTMKYEYIKKAPLYETKIVDGKKKKSKLLKRNFKAYSKYGKDKISIKTRENVLHSVRQRIDSAKKILKNTASGSFTGKY